VGPDPVPDEYHQRVEGSTIGQRTHTGEEVGKGAGAVMGWDELEAAQAAATTAKSTGSKM
jgi:hypothetical protein